MLQNIDDFHVLIYTVDCFNSERNARPLANVSAFWAGQVENWPEQVEFCIENIKDICFWASTPKI